MTEKRTPLTQDELLAYGPNRGFRHYGSPERYFCPIHRSDKQRSLALFPDTGYFICHNCSAWGYLEHKVQEWAAKQNGGEVRQPSPTSEAPRRAATEAEVPVRCPPGPQLRPDLEERLKNFSAALPGSPGQAYLERKRGISLPLALKYGLGFARDVHWPGRWTPHDRITAPHTIPSGEVVGAYGRAIGDGREIERGAAHDHVKGPKGLFNAPALLSPDVVYLTEGVFDALSLIAAGYEDACAIFGLGNLNWSWVKAKRVCMCFDADTSATKGRVRAYAEAVRFGKEVYFLDPRALQGFKDLNEFWVATGHLDLDGRTPPLDRATAAEIDQVPITAPPSPEPVIDWSKVPVHPRKAVSLLRNYVFRDDDDSV